MISYIPIQKAKKYDLKGFSKIRYSQRQNTFPLFEIPMPADDWSDRMHVRPHQDKIAYLLECKTSEIVKALGSHQFCLDISSWASNRKCDDGRHIIDHLIFNAKKLNADFSVCLNYGAWDDKEYRKTLVSNKSHIRILRLEQFALDDSADESYFQDQLIDIVESASLDKLDCIVLLDFGFLNEGNIADKYLPLERVANVVSNLGFVNIAVSGGSVPQMISNYVENESEKLVPRYENMLFEHMLANGKLENPIYSDYGIRPPGAEADFRNPNANAKIRYTVTDGHMLFRGISKKKKSLKNQHPVMAKKLKSKSYFMGRLFSWGDAEIFSEAGGGLGEWIAIDTNHHIEFVSIESTQKINAYIQAARNPATTV